MRWLAFSALIGIVACVGRLPRPTYSPQTTAALEPVTYPPPPARVEFVPALPVKGAVWIDGEWTWQGRRWAWRVGRWVVPPPNARFAPWTTVRSDDGTIYFAPGIWVDAKHQPTTEPTAVATGQPTIADVVDPEGTLQHTGKSIRSATDFEADAGIDGSPADDAPDARPADAGTDGSPTD
jgi:hypothetical protein